MHKRLYKIRCYIAYMRIILTLLILWTLITCPLNTIARQTDDQQISYIKSEVKRINQGLNQTIIERLHMQGTSLDDAETLVFLNGDNKRKIVINQFGETGKVSTALYYDDKGLIYAHSKKHEYNRPIQENTGSEKPSEAGALEIEQSEIEENQYFFNDETMIRWQQNQSNTIQKEELRYKIREEYLLELSNTLSTQIKANR